MKIDSYHLSWIIGINGNSQINKTLRRKLLEVNLCDLDLENIFFHFLGKAQVTREKKNGLYQNLKLLCCKQYYQESKKDNQMGRKYL